MGTYDDIDDEKYRVDEAQVPLSYRIITVRESHNDDADRILQCDGCGRRWTPRKLRPKRCAGCNANIDWDRSDTLTDVDEKAGGGAASNDDGLTVEQFLEQLGENND